MQNNISNKTICIIKSKRLSPYPFLISDGGTNNIAKTIDKLLDADFNVVVFTRHEIGQPKEQIIGKLRIYRIDWNPSMALEVMNKDYEEGLSFINNLIKHPRWHPTAYTAIHIHHWTSGIGLVHNIPNQLFIIYTPHLLTIEKKSTGYSCWPVVLIGEQQILKRSNKIIAVSAHQASLLNIQKGIDGAKVAICPNGISEHFYNRQGLLSFDTIKLVTVARMSHIKGIDVLVKAVEHFANQTPNLKLKIICSLYNEPNYESQIKKLINSDQIKTRIRILEGVDNDNIMPYLAEAHIYIQPSRYETQCIALLEAMAMGLITISARLQAVEEYVQHGTNGFLFEKGDYLSLSETLRYVVTNFEKMQMVRQNAHQTALLYSLDKRIAPILKLYSEISLS